ncbi:uncharacterized protein LOC144569491 isoform X2 [Carex rostrata]
MTRVVLLISCPPVSEKMLLESARNGIYLLDSGGRDNEVNLKPWRRFNEHNVTGSNYSTYHTDLLTRLCAPPTDMLYDQQEFRYCTSSSINNCLI